MRNVFLFFSLLLLLSSTGCVSRNGTYHVDDHNLEIKVNDDSEVSAQEGEEPSIKNVVQDDLSNGLTEADRMKIYKKADNSLFDYKDVRLPKDFKKSRYNKINTHYFNEYYDKDLTPEQRKQIRLHFRDLSEHESAELKLVKKNDKFYHYIFDVSESEK